MFGSHSKNSIMLKFGPCRFSQLDIRLLFELKTFTTPVKCFGLLFHQMRTSDRLQIQTFVVCQSLAATSKASQ